MNTIKYRVDRIDEGIDEFIGCYLDRFRKSRREVSSPDLFYTHIFSLNDATDAFFEILGSSCPDQEIVFGSDELNDRIVEGPARSLNGLAGHDSASGNHCHFRSTASDIDDKMSVRL